MAKTVRAEAPEHSGNPGNPGKGRVVRLPDWVEPELATLTQDRFSDPAWLFERKLDGERCLAFWDGQRVRLVTRNRKEVVTNYPELGEALGGQFRSGFIVDGEIVAFEGNRTSFELLQQRIHVIRPGPELRRRVPVYYYLFDVLYADGNDVRARPLRERKDILADVISFGDPLRFTEHRDTEGEEYYAEACRLGWEGLIAKLAGSPYQAGRSRDWLKFKCQAGQEFVIGGYTDPQRSRVGFGALLLGYYDSGRHLVYAGKVGTGFDNKTLRSLHDELAALERDQSAFDRGDLPRSGVHWAEPQLVAQVAFSEWTRDGQLRHPRFQGLRRDKAATEVVREVPS
jgi:bifunctional non-homologous end joining protein LigD